MSNTTTTIAQAGRPCVDKQLKRYCADTRKRLRKLARRHRNLSDLLYTFPGLAYGLVNGYGSARNRNAAMALARDGGGLKKVAAAAGMPYWMRALPPETFEGKLKSIRTSPDFARRIGNLIPNDKRVVGRWFAFVYAALAVRDESLAVWIAKQKKLSQWKTQHPPIAPLAAYCWFSNNRHEFAGRRIRRPFEPGLGTTAMIRSVRTWLTELLFGGSEAWGEGEGGWFAVQNVCGIRFVPLHTADQLTSEGYKMKNCVEAYAWDVAIGESLIYSLRLGNHPVATMEICPSFYESGSGYIAQLYGPGNVEPCQKVRRAAETWLDRQGPFPAIAARTPINPTIGEQDWAKLWAPYQDAIGADCPIPADGNVRRSVLHLIRDLRELCVLDAGDE